jgi:Protein of unknown function (DUF2924)
MDGRELRAEWQRLFRRDAPPRTSKKLLRLGVAWKIQVQAFGGLNASVKRELSTLAASLHTHGDIRRERVARLKPGAKLIREWQGEPHTVVVLEKGFEWQGRAWRSLTAIARAITGGRWSGPRFFGLTQGDRRAEVR